MKKLVALVLSVVLALVTLTACGGAVESTETAAVETEATASRDTVSKIAVLLPGSITDESWNQTAYEGLQAIEAANEVETAYTENVGVEEAETIFRSYCEEGYDFVLGHGAQYGDACCRVAADFPNVNFFITGNAPADVAAEELPANIMFADYRECEGS